MPSADVAVDQTRTRTPDVELRLAVNAVLGSLADPLVPLETKRSRLRDFAEDRAQSLSPADAAWLSAKVASARPIEHQYELCLDLVSMLPSAVVPRTWSRIEATDRWGAPAQAVVIERGVAVSTGFTRYSAPTCLPGVYVRFVSSGEMVFAPLVDGVATAHEPGPGPITAVTAVAQLASLPAGWDPGAPVYVSGGVRVATWRRFLHVDLALKVSTFSFPHFLSTPAGLSVDAFVGVPFEILKGSSELRGSVDVGVWSTLCPTLRVSAAVRRGHFFAGLDFSAHVFPVAFVTWLSLPLANYFFFSGGLAIGWAL